MCKKKSDQLWRNVGAWQCWCHALLTPAERWLQYDVARLSPLRFSNVSFDIMSSGCPQIQYSFCYTASLQICTYLYMYLMFTSLFTSIYLPVIRCCMVDPSVFVFIFSYVFVYVYLYLKLQYNVFALSAAQQQCLGGRGL